jgi:hypothetical protein
MNYIEALAPYTSAQQMKLSFLVFRKLNGFRGDHFNAIAEASVDGWEEPRSTEQIIEAAHEIWAMAASDDDRMGEEWFAPSDEAIDLAPLIRWSKRNNTWNDMPKGWSKAA